jgi:hypothetical protein
MKDMNVAKLTAGDLLLFSGIISDLFPGTEVPVIDNEDLTVAVEAQFLEQGLQVKRCITLTYINLLYFLYLVIFLFLLQMVHLKMFSSCCVKLKEW